MPDLYTAIKQLLHDILLFCEHGSGITLRNYQEKPALAIVDSVINGHGRTFVVIFPRQSGKNELQAQIECYLLSLYSPEHAEIVKVSPTWKPQSLNAMRRLERVLKRNIISLSLFWAKEQGYIYRVNTARIYFLSGSLTANIVGATASTLLECDEAQDIQISKWDKEINPMAASTNATKVFWGTAWTSRTLLAREKRSALEQQAKDGIQRVFELTADDVRIEVPAYGKHVDAEIRKLGRQHPFVKTQYFSEEIDAEGGIFPPERLEKMQGTHSPYWSPQEGKLYAFLIDIAGEDEAASSDLDIALSNTGRDSTALTIVEVDLSTLDDPIINAPRYLVIYRFLWTGTKHTSLYGQLRTLIDEWNPQHIVIDATGVGESLASFLDSAYTGQVIPFKFTSKSKSDLGWNFIALIETGRFRDYLCGDPKTPSLQITKAKQLQKEFFNQCQATQMEILPGPGKLLRWSVPNGTRDTATGELIHDDLVISAALTSALDNQEWGTAESEVIQAYDPLDNMNF